MPLPRFGHGVAIRDRQRPSSHLYPAAGADDAAPEKQPDISEWNGPITSLAGKTAVVIEDEGITQLQIRKILARAGVKVLGYESNGLAGIATVLATRPDLVLMDINMPGSVDGLEAARQILAAFKTCVVILTAYDDSREEAAQAGASGYVVKPVTQESLLPKLKAACDRFYAA